MPNLDKIRNMNDEELIDFLIRVADVDKLYPDYCSKYCPNRHRHKEDCKESCPSDEDMIREWANKKAS